MAYASWSVSFGEQPSASKWNILGTNDSFFNDFITGAAGTAWTPYTPTITNGSVGNGSIVGSYSKIGRLVTGTLVYTLGSTSTVGTNINFTVPVTAGESVMPIGVAYYTDADGSQYPAMGLLISTTTVQPIQTGTAGTYGTAGGTTATVPFTWTTSDLIRMTFVYKATT